MNSEWWTKVEEAYHTARELSGEERSRFLDAACKVDSAMRRQIEVLLQQNEDPDSFLNRPAVEPVLGHRASGGPTGMLDDATVLGAGAQFGAYRIEALIGEGGMGVVYRARDTKLNRSVAIKFLSDDLADATARRRFQREAQMASSLNHPHILTVHDAGEFEGRQYLVTEFVDGGTLSKWAQTEKRTWRQVVELLTGVADGLAAAHAAGILHRDVKPANILVASNGYAKLADFGVAKLAEGTGDDPTRLTEWRTVSRVIIGTIAYMSPEQASGKPIDARSDIFSFGVVLYEMLAGRKPFEGATNLELMQAIVQRPPKPLDASIPPALQMAVEKALEKEPAERYQSMRELVVDLRRMGRQTVDALPPVPGAAKISHARVQQTDGQSVQSVSQRRERLWILALALTLIAAAAIVWAFRPVPAAPEMRVEITTPSTADPASLAISPDGQKVAFAAIFESRSRLWLRSLDSVSARPLAGTDYAQYPFWSPDSRSVGFYADGKLKRIDIDGGSVQALADVTTSRGGAWNRDGTILFTPGTSGPIFRISATGGEPAEATRLEAPQQSGHRFPHFLPDGRHFLYYVTGTPEARGVYIGQLEGLETRRVLDADAAAVYASSGQILFVRHGTLLAQNFDPVRLALTGNPSPVAEQITVDAGTYLAALSASAAGPIAYRAGSAGGQRQFAWFDRSGNGIGTVGDPDRAALLNPSMSPDGRRVALHRTVNGNTDLWLMEMGRGVLTRFTFDAASEGFPVWSPDGNRIVFASSRKGVGDLYEKPATAAGSEELLLATAQNKVPMDLSPDGRFLLYGSIDPKMSEDIWALPLDGDRKPFPVVQTNFDERNPQFSPGGTWIAYQSNESGRVEIYVQPFPGPDGKSGGKWQVSTNGGAQVRWRRDGKELFYIALDDRLMAVPIRVASNGQAVEAGPPVPLFATRVGGALQSYSQQYIVSPDGQRFLMNTLTEEATSPITIILNWKAKP